MDVSRDYEWKDNGNGTAQSRIYTDSKTDIVFPDTLDGLKVMSIGNTAFLEKQLTSIKIPKGITSIGDYTF